MPETLVAIQIGAQFDVTLTGTMTLRGGITPSMARGFDPEGDAVFWSIGEQWRVSMRGGAPRTIAPGDQWTCGGLDLRAVAVPIGRAAHDGTRSRLGDPLTLIVAGEQVRIQCQGASVLTVSGVPGRVLASVSRRGGSAHWRDVVEDVWPGDRSGIEALRRRFDAALRRLREHLEQLGPSAEGLVVLDGSGGLMIDLGSEDQIEVRHEFSQ